MLLSDATVLLVDDEPDLLRMFDLWFRREQCRVLTAMNGAQALDAARSHHLDLVISDIKMPVMDGIELTRRLREDGTYLGRVILVTGFSDMDDRESLALGAQEKLAKPILRKQLLAAAARALVSNEERWSQGFDASASLVQQDLSLAFESLDKAVEGAEIAIGSGGFCLPMSTSLKANEPVRFSLDFVSDGRALRGLGRVRWTARDEGLAGIEITHVDENDRSTAAMLLQRYGSMSIIPRACKGSAP